MRNDIIEENGGIIHIILVAIIDTAKNDGCLENTTKIFIQAGPNLYKKGLKTGKMKNET